MFISGKEIVIIDNKEFIRLSDAMQVIAPNSTNAARWFKHHPMDYAPEAFVYSDERFPGKRNRVWITVPEGFQVLAEACIRAPRLKVLEGVEERIAPFLVVEGVKSNCQLSIVNCQSASIDRGIDECLVHFDKNFRNGCQNGQKEANGQNKGGDYTKDECQNKGPFIPPFIRDTTDATTAMPSAVPPGVEVGKAVDDEVDIEFDSDIQGVRKPHHDEASLVVDSRKHEIRDTDSSPTPPEERKIVYQETQEKIYGMTETFYGKDTKVISQEPQGRLPCAHQYSEEWFEFLQQSLSDLVAKYYTKMCWLKRAQAEAPEEIHAAFADLTNTLHDTLIGNVIVDILKYNNPLTPFIKGEEPKATGTLDQVEEYLSRGYEISFEADKEGILCRLLSGAIGVNAVAANWRDALVEAIKQIP